MRKTMCRLPISLYISVVVCMIVLTMTGPSAVAGDDVKYLDLSDDDTSYARMVAELNNTHVERWSRGGERVNSDAQVAMLCRTDGRKPDFSFLSPLHVLRGPNDCYTLFFESLERSVAAANQLRTMEGIRYAEADSEVRSTAMESDTTSFYSWGAERMGFGSYLAYVSQWGSGCATVAVIDSGVSCHPIVAGRIIKSGYDYVDADDDSTNDLYGHGTNVAGIIADCTSGQPICIEPIRVLDASGRGKMSNVVNAVREAVSDHVQLINLSLESTVMSEALDEAILDAVAAGVTVVVAAGNSAVDTMGICPAHLNYAGVIVVGAAEAKGGSFLPAAYTNYGESVDIYAPGSRILCCSADGDYSTETGTSMAAPHVSAFGALLKLIHHDLAPADMEERIRATCVIGQGVAVPDLDAAIPVSWGMTLWDFSMGVDEVLTLPLQVHPLSASERIRYNSSNKEIMSVDDGVLVARMAGTAQLTAACVGFENMVITVEILDRPSAIYALPSTLDEIDDEAFAGNSQLTQITVPIGTQRIGYQAFGDCPLLWKIEIPDSVQIIDRNSFSGAIVVCPRGSAAHEYAMQQGLRYILTP